MKRLARGQRTLGFWHRTAGAEDPCAADVRRMPAEFAWARGGETLDRMSRRMEEGVFAAKGLSPDVSLRWPPLAAR